MSKLINEMKLSGIDVDSERLQHSKFETRSLHGYNMRSQYGGKNSVYQSQDAKGAIRQRRDKSNEGADSPFKFKTVTRNNSFKSQNYKVNIKANLNN